MRHAIDQSLSTVLRSVFESAGDTFDSQTPLQEESASVSLRSLLPQARFFSGKDIEFRSIASTAATAQAGELVVYRIGGECPSRLVADAIARGAAGILTEQVLPCPLPQCIVGDVDLAIADIAANRLHRPDRQLLTVGIVGRDGKTSTSLLVSALLRGNGIRTAYQTDLGESDGVLQSTSPERSPGGAALVEWIGDAHDAGCRAAVVEVSDGAARRGDYEAIQFDLLIVTGTETAGTDFGESGLQCALQRLTGSGVVIAPSDDPRSMRVIRDTGSKMLTYGVRQAADVTAKLIDQSNGMSTLLVSHDHLSAVMETSLCGAAMAANHAAATTVGLLLGLPLTEIVERLGQLHEIPGRGQRIQDFGSATVVLDAAGSPERALTALRTQRSMKGTGRLWVVLAIDAGDAPDALARYGSHLERFADEAIVTADGESKRQFLNLSHCVLDGVQRCAAMRLVADQERAIAWAISEAAAKDTILVLGGTGGDSARQRRAGIERLVECVDRERRHCQEACKSQPAPADSGDREAGIYKISDYRVQR